MLCSSFGKMANEGRLNGADDGQQVAGMPQALWARMMEALEGLAQPKAAPAANPMWANIKPSNFDGTDNIELFIAQVEEVADLGEWADGVTLLQLREMIKDTAYSYGRHCVPDSVPLPKARRQLASLKREAGVTLQEQAAGVSHRIEVAYEGILEGNRAEMVMEQFLFSLGHLGLQHHILAVDAPNLEAAVRAGTEYLQIAPKYTGNTPSDGREVIGGGRRE